MLLSVAITMVSHKKHTRNIEQHNAWESELSKLAKSKDNRYYCKYILDATPIETHNSLTLWGSLENYSCLPHER